MSARIIDGKATAQQIKDEVHEDTARFKAEHGTVPGLAFLIVGEDPASQYYVRSKGKACDFCGFYSETLEKEAGISQQEVLDIVEGWNNRDDIHGILVQLPLPDHIDENAVILTINPDKDVDGFHPVSMGRLVIGQEGLQPCTPAGIQELLKRYNVETKGKHVVVVGRSNIVGKPIANMLVQKQEAANAIVTVAHSAAEDLGALTRQADILIAAVGRPEMITADMVKEGVVAIDVGINRVEDPSKEKGYRVTGDIAYDEVAEKASMITPVPGGVGPMTIAMLMKNTLSAANRLVTAK